MHDAVALEIDEGLAAIRTALSSRAGADGRVEIDPETDLGPLGQTV